MGGGFNKNYKVTQLSLENPWSKTNQKSAFFCCCLFLYSKYILSKKAQRLFLLDQILDVDWHFIDLSTVVLFNISQYSDILILHEVDSNTLSSESS